MQLGLVEAPVVVDPTLHDVVEHPRKVREGLVTAVGQVPGTQHLAHRLDRLLAGRGQEAHEVPPGPADRQPGPERVPEERERRPKARAEAGAANLRNGSSDQEDEPPVFAGTSASRLALRQSLTSN